MLDRLREVFYTDKIFDNPILGKVSCASFNEAYFECKMQTKGRRKNDPCSELNMMARKCYHLKDNKQVNEWIFKEFQESLMMIRFLEHKKSTLPEKLFQNNWGIFTNKNNLAKYEKYIKIK